MTVTVHSMFCVVVLQALFFVTPVLGAEPATGPQHLQTDICIYGGTSGGVIAAVQAARSGKKAVLVEPGRHLGGMTASGLGAVDIGDPRSIGGLAREYFTRLTGHYGLKIDWEEGSKSGSGGTRGTGGAFATEPGVAEQVFQEMLQQAGVTLILQGQLHEVEKAGLKIVSVRLANNTQVQAKIFIDATYEGDLLSLAGVSSIVGREANTTYGETVNGIQPPALNPRAGRFEFPLDPYKVAGDPTSGLIPLVQADDYGVIGDADHRVQSYNYRLCLTDVAANSLPIVVPAGYREEDFELLSRWIHVQQQAGKKLTLADFCKYDRVPNGKYDFNNRWPLSTDLIGGAHGYAAATPSTRREIEQQHENYLRGFFYFLAHSSHSPEAVRQETLRYGLARDEFVDNGGWPHQLYVREARRMVSDFVMIEQHCTGKAVVPDPIGLGSYGIDLHAVRRIAHQGHVVNEGSNGARVPNPYGISYQALVPKRSECQNLFAPFCLSASHVAFGSIRMEPVFMVLAHSATTAAVIAIDHELAVQDVPYDQLESLLLSEGQVLSWPPVRGEKK